MVVDFNHDIATSLEETNRFFWLHASLYILHDVFELLVGELLGHFFVLKIFFLQQQSSHSSNLHILMIHGDEESFYTLIETLEWNLIDEVFSFSPALVVRGEKDLDDVV